MKATLKKVRERCSFGRTKNDENEKELYEWVEWEMYEVKRSEGQNVKIETSVKKSKH